MTEKQQVKELPTPVHTESRICFGIEYFETEEDATRYGAHVKERGDTYNGGWFDGMSCGRDSTFDYETDDGQKLFAVTVR